MTSHRGRVPLLVPAGFVPPPAHHPPSPHEGSHPPPRLQNRAERLCPTCRSHRSPAVASALHFPAASSPSPVSIAAFGCLCTREARRTGQHCSSSPHCHISVAGTNDRVSTQCKHNRASFISGGKRPQSSGSGWEEVRVMAVPAPSPPFSKMFKLPRQRFASRFASLHRNPY